MKIHVDSIEYQCWHEVGHATVCLHLGGDVDFIELLDSHARGHARTLCIPRGGRKECGVWGGAIEFYLLDKGYAEKRPDDERDISPIVFHNATADREEFWERRLGEGETFSESEDRAFMNHAIEFVAPIFNQYFPEMQELVRELFHARKVDGRRVKELLRIGIAR